MKSYSRLTRILVYSLVLISFSSKGQEIPEVNGEEFPEFSLNRNECFDGGSLWGYMNGGADIYLEYGFEKLRVEVFSNEHETIKLEIFKMDNPVSAFGIYSIKIFKCEQSKIITAIDCLNRFQFQLLYGNYYIQLINESGSEKAKQAMVSISETLLKKIEPLELELPIRYLADSLNFSLSDIKMVKGDLGIHNKVIFLEDCFHGITDYQIYYAKTTKDGEKVKYYELVFDKPEMKNRFLKNVKAKGFQIIWESSTNILIKQ